MELSARSSSNRRKNKNTSFKQSVHKQDGVTSQPVTHRGTWLQFGLGCHSHLLIHNNRRRLFVQKPHSNTNTSTVQLARASSYTHLSVKKATPLICNLALTEFTQVSYENMHYTGAFWEYCGFSVISNGWRLWLSAISINTQKHLRASHGYCWRCHGNVRGEAAEYRINCSTPHTHTMNDYANAATQTCCSIQTLPGSFMSPPAPVFTQHSD